MGTAKPARDASGPALRLEVENGMAVLTFDQPYNALDVHDVIVARTLFELPGVSRPGDTFGNSKLRFPRGG